MRQLSPRVSHPKSIGDASWLLARVHTDHKWNSGGRKPQPTFTSPVVRIVQFGVLLLVLYQSFGDP